MPIPQGARGGGAGAGRRRRKPIGLLGLGPSDEDAPVAGRQTHCAGRRCFLQGQGAQVEPRREVPGGEERITNGGRAGLNRGVRPRRRGSGAGAGRDFAEHTDTTRHSTGGHRAPAADGLHAGALHRARLAWLTVRAMSAARAGTTWQLRGGSAAERGERWWCSTPLRGGAPTSQANGRASPHDEESSGTALDTLDPLLLDRWGEVPMEMTPQVNAGDDGGAPPWTRATRDREAREAASGLNETAGGHERPPQALSRRAAANDRDRGRGDAQTHVLPSGARSLRAQRGAS